MLDNPSQNERYPKCFDQTCTEVQRAFLQLKTDKIANSWLYFWLEVKGLQYYIVIHVLPVHVALDPATLIPN